MNSQRAFDWLTPCTCNIIGSAFQYKKKRSIPFFGACRGSGDNVDEVAVFSVAKQVLSARLMRRPNKTTRLAQGQHRMKSSCRYPNYLLQEILLLSAIIRGCGTTARVTRPDNDKETCQRKAERPKAKWKNMFDKCRKESCNISVIISERIARARMTTPFQGEFCLVETRIKMQQKEKYSDT